MRLGTFSRILDLLVLPTLLLALALAFLYAPPDRVMHDVYRIFYFHVPAAAAAFVGFGVVFACSIAYLRTRRMVFDRVAAAAGEVGVLFCALGIVMGMLWAKPVWGAFWIPGDLHLVLTAVLFLVYLAYLMIRGAVADEERRARLAAVVGIVGLIGVPLVFFSDRLLHVGNHPALLALDGRMSLTFMVCMLAVLLLFTAVLLRRVRLELMEGALETMRVDLLLLSERRGAREGRRLVAGAEQQGVPVEAGARR